MNATQARHPIQDKPFWATYMRSRYAILFYTLLLMLVVVPVTLILGLPPALFKVLLGAALLAAVMPNATRRTRYLLAASVLLVILARASVERGLLPLDSGLTEVVVGLIGLLAAAGALRFVIQSREVERETIYAALSTYLLAGIFFGEIYWAIEQIAPGSFGAPDKLTEASSIYFSFVTLASLGYGDILPRTDLTRGLAIFEVIGGQLYLAVMVARLIGLFSDKNERS